LLRNDLKSTPTGVPHQTNPAWGARVEPIDRVDRIVAIPSIEGIVRVIASDGIDRIVASY